jgi:hypothetical protein
VKLSLTKKAMEEIVIIRMTTQDLKLLRLVASQQKISQADFLRRALRERAGRLLAGADTGPVPVEAD